MTTIGLLGVGILIATNIAMTPNAQATTLSGTHYVDNSSSSCTDSGSGSIATPWCSFAPVNSGILTAGSQLLLERGDVFQQALRPNGTGNSAAWITVGAYGSGARPVIKGGGAAADRTIVLTDPDYWRIQDLELANAGEGLLVNYTTGGHSGLDVERIYAHDIQAVFHGSPAQADDPRIYNSSAITVDIGGAPTPAAGSPIVSDITVRNLEATKTAAIYLVGTAAGAAYPTQQASAISNVNVSEVYAHVSQAPAFAFEPASNLHFTSNYVDCSGHIAEAQGTTCAFFYDISNSTIANNVFVNMNDTGSTDETAVDVEGLADHLRISGNYFANNAGAGIEYLKLAGRPGDYNTNNIADSNTFYNNGGASSSQKGQIAIYADGGVTLASGVISNNIYSSSPNGFLSSGTGTANSSAFTLINNVAVASEYASAGQFSGIQGSSGWHEQAYSGSGSWTDMPTYNNVVNDWETVDGGFVGNFELQPGPTTNWVARTWIAPQAGTVHIRGQVFKDATSGDGVEVLIEKSGSAIWPSNPDYLTYKSIAASDQDGSATNVDTSVVAGDVLRFVVFAGPANDATGDVTSWIPSINY